MENVGGVQQLGWLEDGIRGLCGSLGVCKIAFDQMQAALKYVMHEQGAIGELERYQRVIAC